MIFERRTTPGLAIYTYLVGDSRTGELAVIDPTRDVEPLIEFARRRGLHIRHIIETHVHADFVSGARELKARLDDQATICCSGYADPPVAYADRNVREGDHIEIGRVRLGFVHMPGHTPEMINVTFYDTGRSRQTPWVLFSGDFLFVGDLGRPDLLGEGQTRRMARLLYGSVFDKLVELPDFVEVYPAHGAGSLCGKSIGSRPSSTVGFEKRFNPLLDKKPIEPWTDALLADMPLSPSYFQRLKQLNHDGPPILGPQWPGRARYSPRQVHRHVCENCLILDTRSKEAFAGAHIPGAINIPLGDSLPTWAGWVLPYDRPILMVVDEPDDVPAVVGHLVRVGLDDVRGSLDGGMTAWEKAGLPLAGLETISVQQLASRLDGESLTVLDVRTDEEWNAGHIDGARHIHGGVLQEHVEALDRDRPVAVICGSGYRGSIAASFLKRGGFEQVINVIGGMSAWKQAELPMVS